MQQRYNAIIIGFGKGGKTLAAYLADQGQSVAIVERSDKMYGGTCINIACIPTKTLKASADALELALRLSQFGITGQGAPAVDPAAVLARKEKVCST
ncbi:MAG: FAD-dependent oxidoreductase, partial [Bilophila wadsworthia]